MPSGWIIAQIIGDERSTKVAKIIIVHWRLTFLRRSQICFPMHLYGHHAFVWEKCWEFQTTSPLKPLGQFCSNFMWSLLRLEERKIAKMVEVHWPKWLPDPYMVKTFKILFSWTEVAFGLNLCINHQGREVYQSCWNEGRTLMFDLFTARSSLLPYAFVWAPYIRMGKMLRISNDFSSETSWPILLKFHVEPS